MHRGYEGRAEMERRRLLGMSRSFIPCRCNIDAAEDGYTLVLTPDDGGKPTSVRLVGADATEERNNGSSSSRSAEEEIGEEDWRDWDAFGAERAIYCVCVQDSGKKSSAKLRFASPEEHAEFITAVADAGAHTSRTGVLEADSEGDGVGVSESKGPVLGAERPVSIPGSREMRGAVFVFGRRRGSKGGDDWRWMKRFAVATPEGGMMIFASSRSAAQGTVASAALSLRDVRPRPVAAHRNSPPGAACFVLENSEGVALVQMAAPTGMERGQWISALQHICQEATVPGSVQFAAANNTDPDPLMMTSSRKTHHPKSPPMKPVPASSSSFGDSVPPTLSSGGGAPPSQTISSGGGSLPQTTTTAEPELPWDAPPPPPPQTKPSSSSSSLDASPPGHRSLRALPRALVGGGGGGGSKAKKEYVGGVDDRGSGGIGALDESVSGSGALEGVSQVLEAPPRAWAGRREHVKFLTGEMRALGRAIEALAASIAPVIADEALEMLIGWAHGEDSRTGEPVGKDPLDESVMDVLDDTEQRLRKRVRSSPSTSDVNDTSVRALLIARIRRVRAASRALETAKASPGRKRLGNELDLPGSNSNSPFHSDNSSYSDEDDNAVVNETWRTVPSKPQRSPSGRRILTPATAPFSPSSTSPRSVHSRDRKKQQQQQQQQAAQKSSESASHKAVGVFDVQKHREKALGSLRFVASPTSTHSSTGAASPSPKKSTAPQNRPPPPPPPQRQQTKKKDPALPWGDDDDDDDEEEEDDDQRPTNNHGQTPEEIERLREATGLSPQNADDDDPFGVPRKRKAATSVDLPWDEPPKQPKTKVESSSTIPTQDRVDAVLASVFGGGAFDGPEPENDESSSSPVPPPGLAPAPEGRQFAAASNNDSTPFDDDNLDNNKIETPPSESPYGSPPSSPLPPDAQTWQDLPHHQLAKKRSLPAMLQYKGSEVFDPSTTSSSSPSQQQHHQRPPLMRTASAPSLTPRRLADPPLPYVSVEPSLSAVSPRQSSPVDSATGIQVDEDNEDQQQPQQQQQSPNQPENFMRASSSPSSSIQEEDEIRMMEEIDGMVQDLERGLQEEDEKVSSGGDAEKISSGIDAEKISSGIDAEKISSGIDAEKTSDAEKPLSDDVAKKSPPSDNDVKVEAENVPQSPPQPTLSSSSSPRKSPTVPRRRPPAPPSRRAPRAPVGVGKVQFSGDGDGEREREQDGNVSPSGVKRTDSTGVGVGSPPSSTSLTEGVSKRIETLLAMMERGEMSLGVAGQHPVHAPDHSAMHEAQRWHVGDECSVDGDGRVVDATVAFVGRVHFADGVWVGVVVQGVDEGWMQANGMTGVVGGVRYFSTPQGRRNGMLVRSESVLARRPPLPPLSAAAATNGRSPMTAKTGGAGGATPNNITSAYPGRYVSIKLGKTPTKSELGDDGPLMAASPAATEDSRSSEPTGSDVTDGAAPPVSVANAAPNGSVAALSARDEGSPPQNRSSSNQHQLHHHHHSTIQSTSEKKSLLPPPLPTAHLSPRQVSAAIPKDVANRSIPSDEEEEDDVSVAPPERHGAGWDAAENAPDLGSSSNESDSVGSDRDEHDSKQASFPTRADNVNVNDNDNDNDGHSAAPSTVANNNREMGDDDRDEAAETARVERLVQEEVQRAMQAVTANRGVRGPSPPPARSPNPADLVNSGGVDVDLSAALSGGDGNRRGSVAPTEIPGTEVGDDEEDDGSVGAPPTEVGDADDRQREFADDGQVPPTEGSVGAPPTEVGDYLDGQEMEDAYRQGGRTVDRVNLGSMGVAVPPTEGSVGAPPTEAGSSAPATEVGDATGIAGDGGEEEDEELGSDFEMENPLLGRRPSSASGYATMHASANRLRKPLPRSSRRSTRAAIIPVDRGRHPETKEKDGPSGSNRRRTRTSSRSRRSRRARSLDAHPRATALEERAASNAAEVTAAGRKHASKSKDHESPEPPERPRTHEEKEDEQAAMMEDVAAAVSVASGHSSSSRHRRHHHHHHSSNNKRSRKSKRHHPHHKTKASSNHAEPRRPTLVPDQMVGNGPLLASPMGDTHGMHGGEPSSSNHHHHRSSHRKKDRVSSKSKPSKKHPSYSSTPSSSASSDHWGERGSRPLSSASSTSGSVSSSDSAPAEPAEKQEQVSLPMAVDSRLRVWVASLSPPLPDFPNRLASYLFPEPPYPPTLALEHVLPLRTPDLESMGVPVASRPLLRAWVRALREKYETNVGPVPLVVEQAVGAARVRHASASSSTTRSPHTTSQHFTPSPPHTSTRDDGYVMESARSTAELTSRMLDPSFRKAPKPPSFTSPSSTSPPRKPDPQLSRFLTAHGLRHLQSQLARAGITSLRSLSSLSPRDLQVKLPIESFHVEQLAAALSTIAPPRQRAPLHQPKRVRSKRKQ